MTASESGLGRAIRASLRGTAGLRASPRCRGSWLPDGIARTPAAVLMAWRDVAAEPRGQTAATRRGQDARPRPNRERAAPGRALGGAGLPRAVRFAVLVA